MQILNRFFEWKINLKIWIFRKFWAKELKSLSKNMVMVKDMNERMMNYRNFIIEMLQASTNKQIQDVRRQYAPLIDQYVKEALGFKGYKNSEKILDKLRKIAQEENNQIIKLKVNDNEGPKEQTTEASDNSENLQEPRLQG